MNIQMKTLQIGAAAVVALGLVTAVVLGGTRMRKEVTLSAGTEIIAGLEHEVSTQRSAVGDGISLLTAEPIDVADGKSIPAGAVIRGTVSAAKRGGRVAGAPELGLSFDELEIDGKHYTIAADPFHVKGRNDALKSAAEIGGGTVVGGVAGRILGGKGGALPGALLGAAIGSGVAIQSEGDELVLPAGQRIRVMLTEPVKVSYHPQGAEVDKSER
jgi:hypothetical protein